MRRLLSLLLAARLAALLPAAPAAFAPLRISAQSAVVIDADSGATLYEKDADTPRLIASTTKIMTGFLVARDCDLDRIITVPPAAEGVEGSSMYLRAGERLSGRELLYGLMLHSGNDAALCLALAYAGSEAAFVEWMNAEAARLGLRHTHFANPHGLDSPENYASARDLAVLTREALRCEAFRRVVGTRQIRLGGRSLTNHNRLLWRLDGCVGVKTGYTRAAGRILVSAAEREGQSLICVTLNDPNDWEDHVRLYEACFEEKTSAEEE